MTSNSENPSTNAQAPLSADAKRQAVDPIRGYLYQIWRSVFAWIELSDTDLLYLEGAEDFDELRGSAAVVTQVKDTAKSGSKTLRSEDVLDAIQNFLDVRKRNPGRSIQFKFLTTSAIGAEQGSPFGGDAGLRVWTACQHTRDAVNANALAESIKTFLLGLPNLPVLVREFLANSDSATVRSELIDRIEWFTDEPGIEAVREAIRQKIVNRCDRRGINSAEAPNIVSALYQEASSVITRKVDRYLTRAQFVEIFDRTTSVAVPRAELEALRASAGLPPTASLIQLVKAAGLDPAAVTFSGRTPNLVNPPPLPDRVLKRPELIEEVRRKFGSDGLLVIVGSTGMGKSTLARMYAITDSEPWLWLDCRARDAVQMRDLLLQAANTLADDKSHRNVILDDVDLSTDTRIYELQLSSIAFVLKARWGRLLITSHQRLAQRLQLNLGVSSDHALTIPPFTEDEIKIFLTEQGLQDPSLQKLWARLTWLRTSGHPQLVSARVQTLRLAGFPQPRAEDLIETPIDIQQARTEARQILVSDLNASSRELLYRLSLTTAPIRRERALAIARIPQSIPQPGDALDQLVGPWIEKMDGGYYRISPLVQGVGADANSASWTTEMHGGIARALVSFRELTPSEASSILFHAVMGREEDALVRMSIGLILAEDEAWKHLAPAVDWFVYVTLPATAERERRPLNLFAIRMLQYRIASLAKPTEIPELIKKIDLEFPPGASDFMAQSMRFGFLGQMLVRLEAPLPVSEAIRRGIEFLDLQQKVSTQEESFALKAKHDEHSVDLEDMFAVFVLPRVKNFDDLKVFLSETRSLSADGATRLLKGFDNDESMGAQLLNAAWLSEYKSSEPRWQEFIDAIRSLYERAREWGNVGLARAAAVTGARILNENVNNHAAAIELLDRSMNDTGENPTQLDAKAQVLLNTGDRAGALVLWEKALANWQPSRFGGGLEITFAARNAGIAAARLGQWEKAYGLFMHAYEVARPTGSPHYRIGLLTDAAYAAWRQGNFPVSLQHFNTALEMLESVPNAPDDIATYYLHKIIGGVLSYLATRDNPGSEAQEPSPGCCSNLDPNERIVELNPTPIDFSWMHLVTLEMQAGEGVSIYSALRSRLTNSAYAGVRMQMADLEARRGFKCADLRDIVKNVTALLRALAVLRKAHDVDAKMWEPDRSDLATAQPDAAIFEETLRMYCGVALFVLAARGSISADLIRHWKQTAVDERLDPNVVKWFDFLIDLCESGLPNAKAVMGDNQRTGIDHAIAGIFVATNDGSTPDEVLAAHLTCITGIAMAVPKKLMPFLEHDMSAVMERDWRRLAVRRFQLRSPATTAPAILAACDQSTSGWPKCAAIILAAQPATRWKLPENLVNALRNGLQ